MQVRDLMTTEVFTVRPEHRLDLVDDMMNWQRIRHIPVVDKQNHLIGLVTHRDLLRAAVSSLAGANQRQQRDMLGYFRVEEIMKREPVTITPNQDLRDAAAVMIEGKLGCLPVVEGKRLVGIITEADFLTLAWEKLGEPHKVVDATL